MDRRSLLVGSGALALFTPALASAAPALLALRAQQLTSLRLPLDGTMQAFAFDPVHRVVYVSRVSRAGSAVISRHTIDGRLLDQSAPTSILGHASGLAVEPYANKPTLWTASEGETGATRFRYTPGAAPEVLGTYHLWEAGWHSAQSTLSRDGSWVVSQGAKSTERRIRVFDRAKLIRNQDGALVHEFPLTPEMHALPFQGLAASRSKIFVLRGDGRPTTQKLLCIYSLTGDLLAQHEVRPGTVAAVGEYTEPEGLALLDDRRIAIGFSLGTSTKRSQIWLANF
jgi:hypothetical protein